jgi:hypothetical protein
MSFQRTRMSADRTLMSVIRRSLSLIGFGFHDLPGVPDAARGPGGSACLRSAA